MRPGEAWLCVCGCRMGDGRMRDEEEKRRGEIKRNGGREIETEREIRAEKVLCLCLICG